MTPHSAPRTLGSVASVSSARLPLLRDTAVQDSRDGYGARFPLLSGGGVPARIEKSREATLQTGWCWQGELISWAAPPRPLLSKEAVAISSWCRGHPSSAEEGKSALQTR